LTEKEITKIVYNMLDDVQTRLDEHEVKLTVNKKAVEYLVDKGYDEEYGARPLRRLIQKELENVLSKMIINGELVKGSEVDVSAKKDSLTIEVNEKAAVKS
jgi:ATP-dependent Clp protease ATP-binding subunit ClpC